MIVTNDCSIIMSTHVYVRFDSKRALSSNLFDSIEPSSIDEQCSHSCYATYRVPNGEIRNMTVLPRRLLLNVINA
jgi:hypothetical protein